MENSTESVFCEFNIHKLNNRTKLLIIFRTGGETRTPDTWFWRPVLYQLSYTRIF